MTISRKEFSRMSPVEVLDYIEASAKVFSDDVHKQVGCLIDVSTGEIIEGYNRIPLGVKYTQQRIQMSEKYYWIEHAERDAIYQAAARGIALNNATIYISWYPCTDCARSIINSGIKELVCYPVDFADNTSKWVESHKRSHQMLIESGIKITKL